MRRDQLPCLVIAITKSAWPESTFAVTVPVAPRNCVWFAGADVAAGCGLTLGLGAALPHAASTSA